MSADARPDTDPGDDDLPLLRGEAAVGRVLQQLVLTAASWVLVVAALAAVLSGVGLWRSWLVLPLLVIAAGACWWGVHGIPSRPIPLWSAALLVAITLGSGIGTSLTHSEQVIPRRDSGSYAQGAISLAETHRRLIASDLDALATPGLDLRGITLASPGFYEVGGPAEPAVQPQFVIGPSAIWSLGYWLAGLPGLLVLPAWAMALGVLAIGLLTNGTIGARWGPVAALGTAVLFPILHTARSTYSEPLATLTVAAGLLALTIAAQRRVGPDALRAALLAGLLIGATTLVRIDGVRESILLLVVATAYAARGPRWPARLLAGAAVGTGVGFAAAVVLSYRYLGAIAGSLVPLLALGVALGGVCWASHRWPSLGGRLGSPRGVDGRPGASGALLPWAAAALVIVVGLALASRPWWMTARQSPNDPGARVVAGLQLRQGLVVDGGRTYAEQTVAWLSWWVGPVALVIGLLALAEATRRVVSALRDGSGPPTWFGALVVAAGSTLLTLVRPGITPDHPWAERRLLIALPFVVVLVVAAAATVTRWATRRLPPGAAAVCAIAVPLTVVVPSVLATWPHRAERVEQGSAAVVAGVCRSLGEGDVVLAVDSRAANEWPQVIRGQCGRPALATTRALRGDLPALRAAVRTLDAAVRAGEGRLVLLTADSDRPLRDLGASAMQVVDTAVLEDARLLERRPEHLYTLRFHVWTGSLTPLSIPAQCRFL